MTIYLFPADPWGCGHYRLIWPASVLHNDGHPVRVYPPSKDGGLAIKVVEDDATGRRILTDVTVPEDMTCMVLQRPASDLHPQLIRLIRNTGIPVVVDMDDDMNSLHRDNAAFSSYRSKRQSWKFAAECCKIATLVTTSTAALQKVYAPHGRGRVLDNYVPEAYLHYESPETGRFGWAGITQSHPHDLQVTGDAVRRLIKNGHRFAVVGGPSQTQKALRLTEPPEAVGPVGPEEWAKTIAATLDVGMAPLEMSTFNKAKSRLKAIEYMSVGVPWVSSPREEYRRLHRESGCGLLADTPKQWYEHLKRLITDDVLRKEQAAAGREYMFHQTYQANAWRWMEAWQWAIQNEPKVNKPDLMVP